MWWWLLQVHGVKRFIHVSTDEVYGEGEMDQVGSRTLTAHTIHSAQAHPDSSVASRGHWRGSWR